MKKVLRRAGRALLWPYLYCLIAAGGGVGELVNLETGHPMSHDDQLFWVSIVLAWILANALGRHNYEMAKKTGESWRKLYEATAQKRRSIWS